MVHTNKRSTHIALEHNITTYAAQLIKLVFSWEIFYLLQSCLMATKFLCILKQSSTKIVIYPRNLVHQQVAATLNKGLEQCNCFWEGKELTNLGARSASFVSRGGCACACAAWSRRTTAAPIAAAMDGQPVKRPDLAGGGAMSRGAEEGRERGGDAAAASMRLRWPAGSGCGGEARRGAAGDLGGRGVAMVTWRENNWSIDLEFWIKIITGNATRELLFFLQTLTPSFLFYILYYLFWFFS